MAGPTVASKVRHAIELTNKANEDPSFGDESCRLWTEILSKDISADDDECKLPLPLGAMSASHGLFASTLVRMGKDKMAVVEYTNALNYLKEDGALSRPMTEEEFDIRVGMGRSLQRLPRFWPQGFVLPDDYALFLAKQSTNDEMLMEEKYWILKERSGYGSHGNLVMSTNDLLSMYEDGRLVEAILCQRIVNPPMLIDCRKFTIRVYVIYFPGSKITSSHGEESKDADVYISTEGLVKYALSQYDGDAEDISTTDLNEQYMTNSGRGDGRSTLQHDLHELQCIFQEKDMDYQTLWEIIEKSVQEVMKKYVQLQSNDSLDHLRASIPKILGFDYILNSSGEPFLLEVNRFPGLEPRSSMDADVKHKVVYDAWITACDRMKIPQTFVQNVRPSTYKRCSLKKLSLE